MCGEARSEVPNETRDKALDHARGEAPDNALREFSRCDSNDEDIGWTKCIGRVLELGLNGPKQENPVVCDVMRGEARGEAPDKTPDKALDHVRVEAPGKASGDGSDDDRDEARNGAGDAVCGETCQQTGGETGGEETGALDYFPAPAKRRLDERRPPPPYRKRHKPEMPRRQTWESDTAFAFRILTFLTKVGSISTEQNQQCRRILSEDVPKGLLASLMEFALENDENMVVKAIDKVAPPPPPFLEYFLNVLKTEVQRMTVRTVAAKLVKGTVYAAAVVGTAAVLRVKELL